MTRNEKVEKARMEFEKAEKAAWEAMQAVMIEQSAKREKARNAYQNAMAYAQND